MKSPTGYVLAYLAMMVPTYVLPYLGSNSVVVQAVSAGVGAGLSPLWWVHLWCLGLLVVLAHARGPWVGRTTLWVFPLIAAAFDLVPGMNWVPFVPTALHLGALIMGTRQKAQAENENDADTSPAEPPSTRGAAIGAGVLSVVAAVGIAVSVSNLKKVTAAASAPSPKPSKQSEIAAPPSKPSGQGTPEKASPSPGSKPPVATKTPGDATKTPQRSQTTTPQKVTESGTAPKPKEAPPPKTVRYIDLNAH